MSINDNTNSQIKQCKERGAMPINIGEGRVDDATVKNGNWYNTSSMWNNSIQDFDIDDALLDAYYTYERRAEELNLEGREVYQIDEGGATNFTINDLIIDVGYIEDQELHPYLQSIGIDMDIGNILILAIASS